MRLQIITLLFQIPTLATASVNMKDASFQRSFLDVGFLNRSYSSRSLYVGHFGFGWCSNIESKLDIEADKITLRECESDFVFTLEDNNAYQAQFGPDAIKRRDGEYHLFRGQRQEIFDAVGRLKEIRMDDFVLKLFYQRGISELMVRGRRWQVTLDGEKRKITHIESGRDRLSFEYDGDNLVSVRSGPKTLYQYAYDDLHNLTSIKGRDAETLRYDADQDWVIERVRSDGCVEKFNYERFTHKNGPKEVARANIRCGKKIDSVIYEFFYEKRAGGVALASVRTTAGAETTELNLKGDI